MFKKYRKEIIVFIILIAAYLISRLVNLTALPIFTDEAIYLRWAQTARFDANWRFISLVDGKQPLFVWMAMIVMRFISDPLLAGRLVSVGVGMFSMLFLYLLAFELFKDKKIGLLSSVLYLVFPFSLFFDRMALMESLLVLTTLVSIYLEVLLVKYLRLDLALLLGMSMGAAMLTKTSGFFTVYLLPLIMLLFDFSAKKLSRRLGKLALLILLGIALSQIFYGVLRLSPLFHMISQKDTTFIYPLKEWLMHPWEFFVGNFRGMMDWVVSYLSWPLTILLILSLVFGLKKYWKKSLFLWFWFLIPFTLLALFGKVLYPRFILFMTIPLLILISLSVSTTLTFLKNKIVQIIFLVLILSPSLVFDYKILFNITQAPLTPIDKGQYVNDWPSGWGVRESVNILNEEVRKGKVAIYTDGTFGLMPYAIELYLVYDKNVYIKGIWPLDDKFPAEILQMSKKRPTFLITNQKQNIPDSWPVTLIGQWDKGANIDIKLRLYKVNKEV